AIDDSVLVPEIVDHRAKDCLQTQSDTARSRRGAAAHLARPFQGNVVGRLRFRRATAGDRATPPAAARAAAWPRAGTAPDGRTDTHGPGGARPRTGRARGPRRRA